MAVKKKCKQTEQCSSRVCSHYPILHLESYRYFLLYSVTAFFSLKRKKKSLRLEKHAWFSTDESKPLASTKSPSLRLISSCIYYNLSLKWNWSKGTFDNLGFWGKIKFGLIIQHSCYIKFNLNIMGFYYLFLFPQATGVSSPQVFLYNIILTAGLVDNIWRH